jgi:hypothetical protein
MKKQQFTLVLLTRMKGIMLALAGFLVISLIGNAALLIMLFS